MYLHTLRECDVDFYCQTVCTLSRWFENNKCIVKERKENLQFPFSIERHINSTVLYVEKKKYYVIDSLSNKTWYYNVKKSQENIIKYIKYLTE